MTRIDLTETCNLLLERDNITVLCHSNPDGDTLGSAYALCRGLQKLGKTVRVLSEEIQERMSYLQDGIREYETFDERFVVSVDVADEKLLGDYEEIYKAKIDLAIDHHGSNTGFADKLFLKESAACAEIIYEIIDALEPNGHLFDKEIAAAIYTGISTDTGCFRYSNTSADSHRYTYLLMKYDFNISHINHVIFEQRSKNRIKIENDVMSRVEYYFGDRCSLITLTLDMLEGVDEVDVSSISALTRQIEGVIVGVTFKEKETNVWKVSLRSLDGVNSQEVCRAFGGGGHLRAAGCKIKGTLEDCKKRVLAEIEKQIGVA